MHPPHKLLVPGPPVDPRIYRTIVLSSGAATSLVLWDTVLTLGDEFDYIWPFHKGFCRARAKWIYLFARWFGLFNQVGIMIWRGFIGACPLIPLSTCEAFFILEAITFQLLQLCLYAVLVLQIRAVYQQHRGYVIAALLIVLLAILVSVITQITTFPNSIVDGACVIVQTPAATMCLGVGMIVSQVILWALIYRGKTMLQPVARRSKLISVVVRDGILVLGAVAGVVLVSCLYVLFNQVIINVFIPWMPVVPAVLTPRMILNMQVAARATESRLEFTSHLGTMPDNEIQLASMHETLAIREEPRDVP